MQNGAERCAIPALGAQVTLQLLKCNAVQPKSSICHLHLSLHHPSDMSGCKPDAVYMIG